MPGYLDMEHFTAGVTDHEEGIEGLEPQRLDTEEVTSPGLRSVPLEKGSPAGRLFAVMLNAHVLGNGSRREPCIPASPAPLGFAADPSRRSPRPCDV